MSGNHALAGSLQSIFAPLQGQISPWSGAFLLFSFSNPQTWRVRVNQGWPRYTELTVERTTEYMLKA